MTKTEDKSLAARPTHRIFATYIVLAMIAVLLPMYLDYVLHVHPTEQLINNVQWLLMTLAINAVGLWCILAFFINRLVTKPWKALQQRAVDEVALAKSKFLAAAGHDLRQPMHALNLYLASLSEQNLPKPAQTCVDNLNKCAKAMNDMLDTLLEIANIDSGATKAQFGVFPIASPIDRIQAEFEPLAKAKGLTLRVARCSAFVNTDEDIVERVLRMLVSNAVRYTQRGNVLIGCRRRGELLRVFVIDTGIGIDQEKQQAIFEEHFQLNNYERNRANGLGLGLTIVQRLAKLLGSPVTVYSRLGVGSSFAIDLPRTALDGIAPVQLIPSNHVTRTSECIDVLVVVVDDEPLIRDATHTLLEVWGYTVINAVDGQDALAQLAVYGRAPDAIVCDYLLDGGENGVNVITMLRNAYQHDIPALLVTGITLPEHIAEIRASGMQYMYKPLDNDKLQAALSQLIE